MANRTASYALSVHGTNPQYLIDKIIRTRIYDSQYWKEHCCQINSADVAEKACDIRYVGGVYGGNIKPVPFICLALKLLQIQPKSDIIDFFLEQRDFKYLRALGAFYTRLVCKPADVYKKLEPLLKDYRKLRIMDRERKFNLLYMDDLIDSLLREERVFDTQLPRLTKRIVLEQNREIEMYKSELEELNLISALVIPEEVSKRRPDKERIRNTATTKFIDDRDMKTYRNFERRERNLKSRFSQEEIDSENTIRAKLGIKLLRV